MEGAKDVTAKPHCSTCQNAHMKDYEYPCRGCDEFSQWQLFHLEKKVEYKFVSVELGTDAPARCNKTQHIF